MDKDKQTNKNETKNLQSLHGKVATAASKIYLHLIIAKFTYSWAVHSADLNLLGQRQGN